MNKQEIVKAIAFKANLSKEQAERALNASIEVITDGLVNDESITLVGFGAFSVIETAERQGRNPATGESITIPAGRRVKFKAGKTLKDAVQ